MDWTKVKPGELGARERPGPWHLLDESVDGHLMTLVIVDGKGEVVCQIREQYGSLTVLVPKVAADVAGRAGEEA